MVHVNVAAKQVVVLVFNGVVVEGRGPKGGAHEIVWRALTAVGVGGFLSRTPLPVKLGVVRTEGDGTHFLEEMVAVGVLTVFRGLVVQPRVVHDGDAVRRTVGDPQFVGSAGVEFQVSWVVQVVGSVGDDRFNEPVTKGLDRRGTFCHGGVGGERKQQHEHQ